jgi:voltage-gated potassium channel
MQQLKRSIYQTLIVPGSHRDAGWFLDMGLITLISLNVLAIVLDSVPLLHEAYRAQFYAFEIFSVSIFSVEYLLRLWAITEDPAYAHPFWGRLRYFLSASAIIDLLAILPFYAGLFAAAGAYFDARFIRILRLFRLFRLLKLFRYVLALQVIGHVFRAKRDELLISLTFILFLLLMVSCAMYYVERGVEGTQFVSIPATMWWGVATLTTVGYGDIYPVTPLGKLLGGVIAILGIGLFALPTGILAAGTTEEIERAKRHKNDGDAFCSCCGQPLNSDQ